MINKQVINKLFSLAGSTLCVVLFLYFLPSILMVLGYVIVFLVVTGFVITFLIKKNIIKTNFRTIRTPKNAARNQEEVPEMKDVTHSNDSK